jgi:hypothetical protein
MPQEARCRFGSWLVAFGLMVEGRVLRTCEDPEVASLSALQWMIWQMLRALGEDGNEAAFHLVAATLGLTRQEFPTIRRTPPDSCAGCDAACTDSLETAARAALHAGSMADHGWSPKRTEGGIAEAVDRMLDTQVWLLRVKTHEVQKFLKRGTNLWMRRGASAWVSHSLAVARELLPELGAFNPPEETLRPFLLTDVDAVAGFACFSAPPCESLCSQLEKALEESFRRENPKLWAFREAAPSLRDRDVALRACFPRFRLESELFTLRSLCGIREWKSEDLLERERETARSEDRYSESRTLGLRLLEEGTCAFVADDEGLLSVGEVPWRRGELGNPSIGWCGIVWSLAGATYRAHTLQGLAAELDLPPLQLPRDHSDWRRLLGEEEGEVAYLMLDGDMVGRKLGTLPYLSAIQAGLDLLEKTQRGLLAGIQTACGAKADGLKLRTLPVELVYLGGDDLMVDLPSRYLDAFLEGFSRNPDSEEDWGFTGVALLVPPIRGSLGPRIPELVADLILNALKWAKATRRNEPPQVTMGSLKEAAFAKGFAIQVCEEPISRAGSLMVFGIRIEPLASKAERFARAAHSGIGHLRKYTAEPYEVHLEAVARRVGLVPKATESMVAAAWLHDVLEDIPTVTAVDLETEFGSEVASLVLQLTDISRPEDGRRAVRKAMDRDHLATASPEAQTIKLADLLDNATSIVEHDRAFAPVFLGEMRDLVDVLVNGDHELLEQARLRVAAC